MVLRDSSVPHLVEAEHTLQDAERMLICCVRGYCEAMPDSFNVSIRSSGTAMSLCSPRTVTMSVPRNAAGLRQPGVEARSEFLDAGRLDRTQSHQRLSISPSMRALADE